MNAGSRWSLSNEQLLGGFHVWRTSKQTRERLRNHPSVVRLDGRLYASGYELLTENEPVIVSRTERKQKKAPDGWPAERIYKIDPGLPDGVYSYRVSGIDLFGRHSPWSPEKQITLTDWTAPPPPSDVSAELLDPEDPWVQKDKKYADWRKKPENKDRLALRVRWKWQKDVHQRQSPDVKEFHVYLHDGVFNVYYGKIGRVTPRASGGESTLETDIKAALANLENNTLTAKSRRYRILSSGPRSSGALSVVIQNQLDSNQEPTLAPDEGTACRKRAHPGKFSSARTSHIRSLPRRGAQRYCGATRAPRRSPPQIKPCWSVTPGGPTTR